MNLKYAKVNFTVKQLEKENKLLQGKNGLKIICEICVSMSSWRASWRPLLPRH